MRITVLCPHFDPDTAPTGRVMSRIVAELAALGHELHVVTSLPWYRTHGIEPGWGGRLVRTETMPWGSITRVHPFCSGDKTNLVRRALGFLGFSALVGLRGLVAGGRGASPDVVLVMSPPLTLGLTGWVVSVLRRSRLVFNIQDVFPDAAVETGAITNPRVIAAARWLERVSYHRSDVVTVLSEDLAENLRAKVAPQRRNDVVVIPNFVDTAELVRSSRHTDYRRQLGVGDSMVVMYAGNLGLSQSLELVLAAARALPEVNFVINGEGSGRAELERQAEGLANLVFVDYQPAERLNEVLASGDIHLVPLRAGLGRVSVPSKTYSILAAGRPVLAAIDPGTEVPRILEASGAGVWVPPDDEAAFVAALREMVADPDRCAQMGANGRRWVETSASPRAVAVAYEAIFTRLSR
jgi:colanic acid biosynthesis glycosyl transferase WcaI